MEAKEILKQLSKPFPATAVSWRVGATNADKSKGIALAYIDARDVMERLDDVVGFENWQCRYPFAGCCEISIKINGEWVTKANAAGKTQVEAEKGEASDAFKRAGVLWGIGRYLYKLENNWVELKPSGRSYTIKTPPQLPKWALPEGDKPAPTIESDPIPHIPAGKPKPDPGDAIKPDKPADWDRKSRVAQLAWNDQFKTKYPVKEQ